MPYYHGLRTRLRSRDDRARVIGNLLALREQLDREIPNKDADDNLLLATWNIRDFGKRNRRGFGKRATESHYYIAEIISRFDIVAVQEVNELPEWEIVMDILGPDWDYIATDVTDTRLGGNGERLTFAFDRRKVWFKNISGEIVLPTSMLISKVEIEDDEDKFYAGKQFRRTPFITSFQSGWFKFDICTVHLYYGSASGTKLRERVEEIDRIARYLSERADRALAEDKALILLGDFNIVHPEHKTMKALLDNGFVVPKTLRLPSNFSGTKFYDQIAFKTKTSVIDYIEKTSRNPKNRNAGMLEIFEALYLDDQFEDYRKAMKASKNGKPLSGVSLRDYYHHWSTYQLSDHRPLWVRIQTNDSTAYLNRLMTGD